MATIDLMSDFGSFMGPDMLARVGDAVGETPESTQRAANVAVPTLFAGLASVARTEGGAGRLLGLIRNRDYRDPDAMSRLASQAPAALADEGQSLLRSIFGAKTNSIIDDLAVRAGVGRESMGGILEMLAPLVLGIIGRRVREQNLDERGLSSLLSDQTRGIARPVEPRAKRGWPRWLIPVIAIGLLALAVPLLIRVMRDRPAEREVETRVDRTIEAPRPTEGRAPASQPAERAQLSPDLERLGAAMEDSDTSLPMRFRIDGLNFENGSATLSARNNDTINGLAKLMRGDPEARIRLEGNASSTGEAIQNRALSRERADAVRNALIACGIDGERIEVTGRSDTQPIATNETAGGRRANRRTEVVLLS